MYPRSYAYTYATENNIRVEFETNPGVIASGKCGENLTWTFDSDGNLLIRGTGAMMDWGQYEDNQFTVNFDSDPWQYIRSDIVSISIEDGVTSVGMGAFMLCDNLENISIPSSVTTIGVRAFAYCFALTDISYGGTAAQWNELCDKTGTGLSDSVTVACAENDIGIGVTLTADDKIIDANGETMEKIRGGEYKKKNAFVEGASITAKVDVADSDAVANYEFVTANLFVIFYDANGYMLVLQQSEIDLSDPFSIAKELTFVIPTGAKTLKILILSDELVPLRGARMIESPVTEIV